MRAFTIYRDTETGGYTKIPGREIIVIEASPVEARNVFRSRFKRDPEWETVPDEGPDYAVEVRYETTGSQDFSGEWRWFIPADEIRDEDLEEEDLEKYLDDG